MEAEYETNITEILHLMNTTKQRIYQFKQEIENKEIIVCLGNTRSGKSTVVNYIQCNELEAIEDTKRRYIEVKHKIYDGPLISHGSISYTEFPTVWKIQSDSDIVIVDVPGFEDNRGIARDVVNTLFFNQLKHAISVKIVLISDINDIDSDNVQAFINAITKVQNIINDFNELKDAVSVIFTKDCKNYKLEDIVMLLKNKILNVPRMQVKKELIHHMIKHVNNVGILRMPLKKGKVAKSEVDCNIDGAIFNTHSVVLNVNSIKFATSEQTHNVLLNIYQKYISCMDFRTEVENSVQRFAEYFNIEKYVFASTEEELGYTKTHLQYVLTRITTEKTKALSSIVELKDSLYHIAPQLSEGFDRKLKFFEYIDEWLLLERNIKQMLTNNYQSALSCLEDQINKLINKIDNEVEDRTKETIRYIISEAASDRRKLILMSTGFIPLATRTLSAVGIQVPETFTFEIAKISGAASWGLAGAATAGVAAGGYGVLYYQTIYLRQSLRKEQGR